MVEHTTEQVTLLADSTSVIELLEDIVLKSSTTTTSLAHQDNMA